jgi:DNA-binding MarR family transcriptional regulator
VPSSPSRPAALDDLLAVRIGVAGRLLRVLADGELADTGVAAPGLGVLMRLLELDAPTQTELARRQRVEPPSMCRMIDRLERNGLVARAADPADRRASRIRLTPAGREVAERGAVVVADIDARVLGDLSDDERRLLSDLLARVIDRLPPGGGA